MYSDDDIAALYERLNPWSAGDDFYLGLAVSAGSVLDVGCGDGRLLRRARAAGHAGRLCGVDPDRAALGRARRRTDVEWIEGTAAGITATGEFELAVMTGHAFQVLIDDAELRASLAAIRRALTGDGRFVFDTRNPAVREWTEWNPSNALDVVDHAGRELRILHDVESVEGEVVTLTETTARRDGTTLRVDRGRLRFLAADRLTAFLTAAGLAVEERYGGWDRSPPAPDSREIITVARAADR